MSLPEKNSSKNEGTEPGSSRSNCIRGHNDNTKATSDAVFADEPSEYIDSTNILPESESREQLNHFFDVTTSTTPAENAEILQQENARAHGEPETFGETQVGKFLKKLFKSE